jgi:hypothetical protein
VTIQQVLALTAGFAAAFLAILAAVLPFAAWFGGWRRLAEQFAAGPGARGRILLGTATMRYATNYGHVIRLDCRTDGLVLSVVGLFRLAHPPLVIPWSQVESEQIYVLWIFAATRLSLGRDARIPFTFYNREARDLVATFTQRRDQPQ